MERIFAQAISWQNIFIDIYILPGSFVYTRMFFAGALFLVAFGFALWHAKPCHCSFSYLALAWHMFVALIGHTSKCLAFLDKVFHGYCLLFGQDLMPLFASFIYKAMSRTAHTLELNFVHFIHPLGRNVHFDQCKNTLAPVAFCVRALPVKWTAQSSVNLFIDAIREFWCLLMKDK